MNKNRRRKGRWVRLKIEIFNVFRMCEVRKDGKIRTRKRCQEGRLK